MRRRDARSIYVKVFKELEVKIKIILIVNQQ